MIAFHQLAMASLLGLATTSSSMLGAAIGLYVPLSKRPLACLLGFAAGALISALAIELAYEGALSLHHRGYDAHAAWAFVSAGFAAGAIIYYSTSLFLERKGAAVRSSAQFREYALTRKQEHAKTRIKLLAACELMRHLPAEQIERILPAIHDDHLKKGEILFRAGDPGDALYIISRGKVEVLADGARDTPAAPAGPLAVLGEGHAFGEMSLLSGDPRSATIRAIEDTEVLKIGKSDFERLVATDHEFADAVERISHRRAINNLSEAGVDASRWAKVASRSLDHLSRHETSKMLTETANGAGMAIVLGIFSTPYLGAW
jgi:CRP-like cAMP-binding protein